MTTNSEIAADFTKVDQLLHRFEEWYAPMDRFMEENAVRVNRDGYTGQQFDRERRELDAELRQKENPNTDLHRAFERLCSRYLTCDPAGRAETRSGVAARKRKRLGLMFWGYASQLATQIKQPHDAQKLWLALAAVLIEDCGSDYRDTLTVLADLYVGSETVGIDAKAVFRSASELATDVPTPGGCRSLAQMLREFESFAVVAERRRRGSSYQAPI
jgi:hypothetical protein